MHDPNVSLEAVWKMVAQTLLFCRTDKHGRRSSVTQRNAVVLFPVLSMVSRPTGDYYGAVDAVFGLNSDRLQLGHV